jgi:hypothetical protein
MSILHYVQIENALAVIDSRVYCRDIIEVNHGDWVKNILEEHKESVETRFGVIRFENGKPIKGSLGGRPEKYALLTESQCNAFLVLSRNSRKVLEKKLDLIADFEAAKQQIRQQLERSLLAEPSDRDLLIQALNDAKNEVLKLQQKLEQSQLDHQAFCFSSKFLHQVSGIVSFYQVKNAILQDFVEGRDWVMLDNDIYLNESTFNILVTSFRSVRGADLTHLPEVIKLETKLYFQYQELRRKNRRIAQCDGQTCLDLGM